MIVDTDILIWHFHGVKQASLALDDLDSISISSITYMELMQGAKNKQEVNFIKKTLHDFDVNIIQIDNYISVLATDFVEKYSLSHSMQLADALIGATAISNNSPLLTGNKKHFSILKQNEGLDLHVFTR